MQKLLASFVSVADEVGRLQRGEDAECRTFQGFCEQGHYGGRTVPTDTRQGIYAVTPSGRFLASINTRSGANMAAMLRQALARWAELPPAERQLGEDEAGKLAASKRFEDRLPKDGVVLVEYVRDLGRPANDKDWRTRAFNTDHAWFTAAEAASLVPTDAAVGARLDWPTKLANRLVRLHLVDSVRGQTPPAKRDAVLDATLASEVVAIAGDEVVLRFTGSTKTEAEGSWNGGRVGAGTHGVATAITGRARWHAKDRRFTQFELLAKGERWGATQYNERADDQAKTAIGFAFVLAPADAPRVAPAFWWDYQLR
ncbi:MAG: hypothetical protein WAT39_26050 [Planctomycetota bacterium]